MDTLNAAVADTNKRLDKLSEIGVALLAFAALAFIVFVIVGLLRMVWYHFIQVWI